MRINEVIKKIDLSKRAIKFYEEQGLLHINRDKNGYRNYTDENILTLKEISVYRKMGISLSDIKRILKDSKILNDILIQKKIESKKSLEELEKLENYIKDKNIDKLYNSINYDSIAEAIQNAIPGFYGYYFLNHFTPYLQNKIENIEQQEAYNNIIKFWDNTSIKIPLFMKISGWIIYKLNSEKIILNNINNYDSYIKMYLNPTKEEYEKFKRKILKSIRLKNNFFYKYSIMEISRRKYMKELQNKGYNDIFISNMLVLSPKYEEYHNALKKLNDRICKDLNIYYDNDYNIIHK